MRLITAAQTGEYENQGHDREGEIVEMASGDVSGGRVPLPSPATHFHLGFEALLAAYKYKKPYTA